MAGFIEGVRQCFLEGWIGEGDLVRGIDLFVDELDLIDLGFVRTDLRAHRSTGVSSGGPAGAVHLRLSEPHPIEPLARAGGGAQCRGDMADREYPASRDGGATAACA